MPYRPLIEDLARTFEAGPFDVCLAALRRRLQQLGVRMLDGKILERPDAEAIAAQVLAFVERLLDELERPDDALRLLDAVRSTGFTQLEPRRGHHERACAERYPPPAPATWRELDELRALAVSDPEHCRVGPPVAHVAFAARLGEAGTPVPGDLLALYAAMRDVSLACRHVPVSAGSVCAGDALRVRDGRLVLFDRIRRHPRAMFLEQPGISIVQALGTWWLALEDDRAPAIRRPLDLQGLLRFALLRLEAPSLDVLLTDLSWQRFFV